MSRKSEREMYAMQESQTGTKAISSVFMSQMLSKCILLVAWGLWAGALASDFNRAQGTWTLILCRDVSVLHLALCYLSLNTAWHGDV